MTSLFNSLPAHVSLQETPDAGNCLFSSKEIAAGELVFHIDRPLALALDEPRLRETCEGCLRWTNNSVMGHKQDDDAKRLKDCLGCRVVRYCGKTCQARSWKTHHKYECKIFKSLHPKVLPNTVRLLMQLLLRRKAGVLEEAEWRDFLALKYHLDDFKARTKKNPDGLTGWEVIELMSEAASSYSRSDEPLPFVQTMAARILINTHTLTAPSLDPLGLCLSPTSALLNHSCMPNTAITFSDHGALSLRSLNAIPASSALTISYTDSILSTPLRRAELENLYFFTCTCPLCLANCTSSLSNPDTSGPDMLIMLRQHLESQSIPLFAAATASPSISPHTSLQSLQAAEALFTPHNDHYPPHRHPRPAIHAQILLTSLNLGKWALAFRHSLVTYFYIDPVHYPQPWHPVRVVHTWITLRLAMQMADPNLDTSSEGDDDDDDAEDSETSSETSNPPPPPISSSFRHNTNWALVVLALWHQVNTNVRKSHGPHTTFAAEIRAFGDRGALHTRDVPEGEIQREWARLRAVAGEVLVTRDPRY